MTASLAQVGRPIGGPPTPKQVLANAEVFLAYLNDGTLSA